ncbi:MAG: DHH family phosphoesterase [Candidatus Cloacimonetes bacterium]|nr:DHH family phosphoesterase [Candidatus Cloacimonadota bacterium]
MKNIINAKQFVEVLKTLPNTLILTSHINPDGDGIGSMIAMGMALKKIGKTVHFVLKEPVKDYYQDLPGVCEIQYQIPKDCPAFALMTFDCSSMDILSLPCGWRDGAKAIVVLDHHLSNQGFGDYHFVRTDCISSCVLAYEAILALQVTVSPEMATLLYLGLVYDTGRFSYTSDPEAFLTASELLRAGGDHQAVFNCLYRHNNLKQFRTNAELISQIEEFYDGKLLVLEIGKKYENQIDLEETENLINQIADIRDLEIVVVFKYMHEELTKLCFRSRGTHSVSDIALSFGGGGHRCASGASAKMNLLEAREMVLKKIHALCL